jgi:acetyl-CoA C-acetyltransferase
MTQSPRRVAILGGIRIPFARQDGPYAQASNQDMLTTTIDALVDKFGLAGETLGEVAGGAVLKHSRDFNLVRESVLGSKLAPETSAMDVQQACGTGLEAAIIIANKIALGQLDSGIACGVDTTSDAPISLNEDLRNLLLEANRAKTNQQRLALLPKLRPSMLVPEIPRNSEPRTGLSMGEHTAITAKEWGVTREEQDELTVNSHHNLAAAYESGWQDDLVTPYLGLERDQNLRPDSSMEKLGKLAPVFGGPEGTMTAGNCTPLSDGASAVLMASEEWAKEHGIAILAYLVDSQTAAVDYIHQREGLLLAPAYAVPRMLDRNDLQLQDFDQYEIHEAFAAQVLATLKAWEDPVFSKERLGREEPVGAIDRSKLNPHGGSLGAGHPFGATGGRLIAALAKSLHEKGAGSRGLISVCAAGGEGVTAILEGA